MFVESASVARASLIRHTPGAPGAANPSSKEEKPAELSMDDPTVPCGDPRLGGARRRSCQFACCVSKIGRGVVSESDEEYCLQEQRPQRQDKRREVKAQGQTSHRDKRRKEDRPERQRSAMELALSCMYPLAHREDIKNEVAAKLRHLEKLEIAIQGDDYADKDFEETNHEALTYAKAAAAVLGCPWSFEEQLRGGREYALERLKGLPNVGEFRATQIYQLATSYFRTGECTCEALEALTLNRCPKDSDGHVRYQNNAQKQTVGAAAKLELSKLLGVSPLKAGQLYHGTLAGFDAPVCSIAELRAAVARDARAREAASGFAFGLAHYEVRDLRRNIPAISPRAPRGKRRGSCTSRPLPPSVCLPAGAAAAGAGGGGARDAAPRARDRASSAGMHPRLSVGRGGRACGRPRARGALRVLLARRLCRRRAAARPRGARRGSSGLAQGQAGELGRRQPHAVRARPAYQGARGAGAAGAGGRRRLADGADVPRAPAGERAGRAQPPAPREAAEHVHARLREPLD